MKWVLILAVWNTDPPQESFKFYTQVHPTEESCENTLTEAYAIAFDNGAHARAICVSEDQLGLMKVYS